MMEMEMNGMAVTTNARGECEVIGLTLLALPTIAMWTIVQLGMTIVGMTAVEMVQQNAEQILLIHAKLVYRALMIVIKAHGPVL